MGAKRQGDSINEADWEATVAEVQRERDKAITASIQLLARVEAAEFRVAQLEGAIRWALGEEGEFGEEPPPLAGKYRQRFWWRSELRQRAKTA